MLTGAYLEEFLAHSDFKLDNFPDSFELDRFVFVENKKRMTDKTIKALVKVIVKDEDKIINFSFADLSNNVTISKNAIYEFLTKSVLFKNFI